MIDGNQPIGTFTAEQYGHLIEALAAIESSLATANDLPTIKDVRTGTAGKHLRAALGLPPKEAKSG